MSKVAPPLKKRKDDLTAIALAGAQLDWEHRKIREKGVSVKAELNTEAKQVDCMRDRGKLTHSSVRNLTFD